MATDLASILADTPEDMDHETMVAQASQANLYAKEKYSLKKYHEAAELYSKAAELQERLNGEMSIKSADVLYYYGLCLYHVAVANSDVLGGKVASSEEPKRKKRKVQAESSSAAAAESSGSGLIAGAIREGEQPQAEQASGAAVVKQESILPKSEPQTSSTAYFQITGDENWTDSEDDDDDAADGEAEEQEDDFATAFEILDMARVLLTRKLEFTKSKLEDGSKSTDGNPEIRQIRERLADTHDLQAEISLENERFQDAINDTREALALKLQLYPEENSMIAEAHFKLSLALEFASVTSTSDAPDGDSQVAQIDEKMRDEAATEMEFAIASCKLRIAKEEIKLSELDGKTASDQQKAIADVKEMVVDMEQRLVDLRKPPVSRSAFQPGGAPDTEEAMRGMLGAIFGGDKAEVKKQLEAATAGANDLTGLVKHKKKPKQGGTPTEEAYEGKGKGKRKMEDDHEINGNAASSNRKKVKFAEKEAEQIPL